VLAVARDQQRRALVADAGRALFDGLRDVEHDGDLEGRLLRVVQDESPLVLRLI
jgi:hypothetical protein